MFKVNINLIQVQYDHSYDHSYDNSYDHSYDHSYDKSYDQEDPYGCESFEHISKIDLAKESQKGWAAILMEFKNLLLRLQLNSNMALWFFIITFF